MKLWGGRFTKATNTAVETFTASIQFDARLAKVDILGSLAHVAMLVHCKLLTPDEGKALERGLRDLFKQIENDTCAFSIAQEDVHMNIEHLLNTQIGAVAGKLHTGRSRNDQVALDLHLYLREQIVYLIEALVQLQQAFLHQATLHIETLLPGYTHLQRAQPIRLAHHFLAYVQMFARDAARLMESFTRVNTLPLGAGALAGAGFPIDREYVANILGFDALYENSMDAVSDRDFCVEFLSNAALIMMHLSRLSEELILWSSQEFQFIELDDAFCTGSSMMPQKKNPDVPELIRGKTGRVYGALMGMLTLLKGLPLAYNKDLQEDKEGLFDTLDTVLGSLQLTAPLIETLTVRKEAMRAAIETGFLNATQVANYLTTKGLPFRDAHAVSGKLVRYCIEHQQTLTTLSLKTYQQFSELFDDTLFATLDAKAVVDQQSMRGGTGEAAVRFQLEAAQTQLTQTITWLQTKHILLQKVDQLFTKTHSKRAT